MRNKMSVKFSSYFLFLATGFLLLFCPMVGKAQNNSVVSLAGTVWDTNKYPRQKSNKDNSVTTIIYFIGFYNQGRAKASIIEDKSAGAIEKYEYEYVTNNDGTTEYKQVRKLSRTLPSVNSQSWEGTYQIKGKLVYLNFPFFTINATITATSIEGILTHKDTNKEEPALFTRTASPNNLSSATNSPPNSGDKRQLAKTLSTKANDLLSQANDLRDKGKEREAQEKYREAINAFSFIIQIELNTKQYIIDAYILRASIKLGLEDYRGVIEDCSSAIQLSTPLRKDVMKMLSEAKSGAKSSFKDVFQQAIGESILLRELREKNPEVSAAMYGLQMGYKIRAMAKNKFGDKIGACEDYRMLCDFGYNCNEPNEFCN